MDIAWGWVAVVVLALATFGLYASITAGRLDRLHHRVDSARNALDAALEHRRRVSLGIATSGALDPASSLILAQASMAEGLAGDAISSRYQAESELSEALVAVFADADELDVLTEDANVARAVDDLREASRRLELTRRFYNDAVRACIPVRQHRMVRLLRLAGHAALPTFVDFDDTVPPALVIRGEGR